MPEGPQGFPRLTTLAPLVKPDVPEPSHDTQEGVYLISEVERLQPQTGADTRQALGPMVSLDLDIQDYDMSLTEFRYHKRRISDILEINDFSMALLDVMSVAEENGIPLRAEQVRNLPENPMLEKEVQSVLLGEDSIITESQIRSLDVSADEVLRGDDGEFDSRDANMIAEKAVADVDSVVRIAEDIDDDRIYYPPTIEDVELGGVAGWGVIDGSHRLVALSQIMGTDAEIYVWEWENQRSVIKRSSKVSL